MIVTPGQKFDDGLIAIAKAFNEEDVTELKGVPCSADIRIINSFMAANSWNDRENPGRPYYCIQGECIGLHGMFPNDIETVNFPEHDGILVDMRYDFSDDELAELTVKGLYHPEFKPPYFGDDSVLDMPVNCNILSVKCDKDSYPIIFADIVENRNLTYDTEACGYRFADFFESYTAADTFDFDYGEDEGYLTFDKDEHEHVVSLFDDYTHEAEIKTKEEFKKQVHRDLSPSELELLDMYKNFYKEYLENSKQELEPLIVEEKKPTVVEKVEMGVPEVDAEFLDRLNKMAVGAEEYDASKGPVNVLEKYLIKKDEEESEKDTEDLTEEPEASSDELDEFISFDEEEDEKDSDFITFNDDTEYQIELSNDNKSEDDKEYDI